MTSGNQFLSFLFDTSIDILAKQPYNDYFRGERKLRLKAKPLFGSVYAADFSREGITMTTEDFLQDYFHYAYYAYYSGSGSIPLTMNQYASGTFDELNIQYKLNEGRVDFSTQRTKVMVDSIINIIFNSNNDMETFMLSDGRDKYGILKPRLSSSTAQVITKKQWTKWMFDKLTDPTLKLKLLPKGIEYVHDIIREAIEDLEVLKKPGAYPNPIDVTTEPTNYATDLEAKDAMAIFETITKLLGHKTIRNIFMHTIDFYENDGYVLETTTLRSYRLMEEIFKLYKFIYPTYGAGKGPRSNQATPLRNSILPNIFHYLYGNAYFRFTVINGKEYNLGLGYSPMPFLNPNDILSLGDVDSILIGLFKSRYEREFIPNKQGDDIRSQAFFDNSIELFKTLEKKIKDTLKDLHYDEHTIQDALFKVIVSLQRVYGKPSGGDSVRIQIDELMRSRDFGRVITFYGVSMGTDHLKIYLTKADLAGRNIFTFAIKEYIKNIDFDRINMIAVNNKIAALWSILGDYKDKGVKFTYIEDVGIEGWQYIGLTPNAAHYNFITRSERHGLGNPSYLEIETDKLFSGDVNEMEKLLEIIKVSMGFKIDGYGGSTRFGFVMSDSTGDITVFNGQRFLKIDEIRSANYINQPPDKNYHRVVIEKLVGDQNLIDYYNTMWNKPFYYRDLNI